jgi:hypothetical protein
MVSRLLPARSLYWCSALLNVGALFALLAAGTSAVAADVSSLFEEARTTAAQLRRDAMTMETYTRSNVSWRSHSAQISQIKDHINRAGEILSQLQSARAEAQPWHQDTIDRITPVLKQLASDTEAIINHLNENPNRLRDPGYMQYLKSNAQSASELSGAVGNVVDYDNTRTRMEELKSK